MARGLRSKRTLVLSRPPAPFLVRARRLLAAPDEWLEDAALLVDGGRIRSVLRGARAADRSGAPTRFRFDGLVIPGLVNAHAHLELGALGGRLPSTKGFTAWVGALLTTRAGLRAPALERAWSEGAKRLVATGTTAVGDIDTTGAGLAAARRRGAARPRAVLYREVIDAWDPARTRAALAGVGRALRPRADLVEGLSPHAPFTVGPELARRVAALSARRRAPLAIHWSESEDELAWCERGEGPLAAVLPPGPRRRGLDHLVDSGLVGARTALIHGNLPRRGEPTRIAGLGATVVHCPGTHAFFGREPFPFERYRRAGVALALGTDSRASNDDLDMRREMALFRASHPAASPESVFRMATVGGARALSAGGEIGLLQPGYRADLTALVGAPRGWREALELVTAARPDVAGVLVGGEPRRFPRPRRA